MADPKKTDPVSMSPSGETFALPNAAAYAREFERLQQTVADNQIC
ncbi:MAG: hypothetical protein PVJ53_06975 [Desulfobacterales bacterium]|jgi:hypothetical protein